MKIYEVIADEIWLDRRYFRGEEVRLTDDQARYLLMNGKIAEASANAGTTLPTED